MGQSRKRKRRTSDGSALAQQRPVMRVHRDTLQYVLEGLLSAPAAGSQSEREQSPPPEDIDGALKDEALTDTDGEQVDDPAPIPAAPAQKTPVWKTVVSKRRLKYPRGRSYQISVRPRQMRGSLSENYGIACHEPHAARSGAPAEGSSASVLWSQVYRAAQHAGASDVYRHRLEAYRVACALLPAAPRLAWELALALHAANPHSDAADTPPLRTLLEHFVRHGGVDRAAAQLAAFSALVSHGQSEDALEMAASARAPPSKRQGENHPLWRAVCEWARYVRAPPGDARRLHLTTLRDQLRALTDSDGDERRPELVPLLRTVTEELEHLEAGVNPSTSGVW